MRMRKTYAMMHPKHRFISRKSRRRRICKTSSISILRTISSQIPTFRQSVIPQSPLTKIKHSPSNNLMHSRMWTLKSLHSCLKPFEITYITRNQGINSFRRETSVRQFIWLCKKRDARESCPRLECEVSS